MLRERFTEALKQAMKDKDALALSTVRLVLARLKEKDIEARPKADQIDEPAIQQMLLQMIKQRRESIELYERGKRPELAAKEKGEAEDLATIMQGVGVKFTRKAGEHGTLFGSVTAMDVAEKLAEQGYQMDRRKIQLPTPLKLVGEYDVPIKLHREVSAIIKVKVEGDAPVAPAAAPKAAPAAAAEPAAPAPPAAEK